MVMSAMPAMAMISPGAGALGLDALEWLGHVEHGDLGPLDRAVDAAPGDLLASADRAVVDAAQREASDVAARRRGW